MPTASDLSFLSQLSSFPSLDEFSDILTVDEAADILRITAKEMLHLIEEKNIPFISICGRHLILKSFFQNFLADLFKVDYTQNITAPVYCPSGNQAHLDNLIYEPSFGPHEKGTNDMAPKSKINPRPRYNRARPRCSPYSCGQDGKRNKR